MNAEPSDLSQLLVANCNKTAVDIPLSITVDKLALIFMLRSDLIDRSIISSFF